MHFTLILDGGHIYVMSTLFTVTLLVGGGYGAVRLVADFVKLVHRSTKPPPYGPPPP